MNPTEPPPRTLAQEFRDSFRAGRRVWYAAIIILVTFIALPFLGVIAVIFGIFFLLPALFGAVLGRLVGLIRDQRILRRLERSAR